MIQIRTLVLAAVVLTQTCSVNAEDVVAGWVETAAIPAVEARQAAAADGEYLYAIDNRVVAKYERGTGRRMAVSHGDAHHLNSGFLHENRLYCAHSNFPAKPEQSEIKVVDLSSMELKTFHSFGNSPHGSLTVALFSQNAWWCVFAKYGSEQSQTRFVKFDQDWKEIDCWTFPESVISDLGKSSISGGIWQSGRLLATGHDKRVIYLLEVPESGTVLGHIKTVASPFPGQGIAEDPVTGGLVGINRKKQEIILASPMPVPENR